MKRIKFIFLFFVILTVLLIGCSEQTNSMLTSNKNNTDTTVIDKSVDPILSYTQYEGLIKSVADNLNITDFTLKAASGENIVVVEKELTFGKRENLTLDGKRNMANVQPTSHLFIYENQDQSKQIIIRFSFNTNFIGNDLLDWSGTNSYENINSKLASQMDMATLSYKNILITVQQLAIIETNFEITKTSIKEVIQLLKKY
ncbi:hypothetical protein D3C74_133740 [compost metagenome]